MGCGILEDTHLQHVPGTVQFTKDPNALASQLYEGVDLASLKHGTGKHAEIVLVPQPSDDPNDPLNWSPFKKNLTYFVLAFDTVLCGVLGPIVAAAQNDLAVIFNTSVQNISRALGTSLVAALAVSTIFGAACSVKFGKRPVYLISTALIFVGCFVSGEGKTFGSLLGGLIIQGVGQASLEFLVGSSIADIYFTHERGWPVAIWNLALLGGINVTPPISGQIYNALGFRWNFRIYAIAVFVLLLLQFFFLPETTYSREHYTPGGIAKALGKTANSSETEVEKKNEDQLEAAPASAASEAQRPKNSYASELAPFHGVLDRKQSFAWLLFQPIAMCISPVVIFGIATYGLAITLLVIIATGSSEIFATAYNFGPGVIGNTYCSPLLANFIAATLVGPLTDFNASFMSKKNKGVFEPEFRLLPIVFYLLCGGLGLIGFGLSISNPSPWGSIFCFGLLNFGVTFGCSAVISYIVDVHKHSSDAALGAVIFGKNVLSAICTSETNNWLGKSIRDCFLEMGGLAIGTSLLAIPMYIYGKRCRSYIARKLHFEQEGKTIVD